jgi:serine acetyltransferase
MAKVNEGDLSIANVTTTFSIPTAKQQQTPALDYLLVLESMAIILLETLTLVWMCRLIHAAWFRPTRLCVQRLSNSMRVYLGTHIAGAIISTPFVPIHFQ